MDKADTYDWPIAAKHYLQVTDEHFKSAAEDAVAVVAATGSV
jgi:hypothetical protein